MQYRTEIDSIGLKCEFNRASVQRDKLSGLKSYINSIVGLSVIPKERIIGYGATILEYYVYYKNITIAIIKTGAYRANKSIEENTYYINCKNRSKPDNDARVRPDAKTEFNRTVKRCSTGH